MSSLSQRLRDLEERLGVRLLHRTTRSVAPTEAGERCCRGSRRRCAMSARRWTVRGREDVPAGRLRINAPAPAIDLVLAPMVDAVPAALSAGSSWRSSSTPRSIDIVAEGFDAGVRFGEHLAQDMIAVPLGPPQRYAVVASPAFVAHTAFRKTEGICSTTDDPHPLPQRRDAAVGVREGRPRGQASPPADCSRRIPGCCSGPPRTGSASSLTFEGYARDAIAPGALVRCWETGARRSRGRSSTIRAAASRPRR